MHDCDYEECDTFAQDKRGMRCLKYLKNHTVVGPWLTKAEELWNVCNTNFPYMYKMHHKFPQFGA